MGFPGVANGKKNLPASTGNTRDTGLIPGSERFPGVGNGNPLYSCLENPMDRGVWKAIIQGAAKESDMTEHKGIECCHLPLGV